MITDSEKKVKYVARDFSLDVETPLSFEAQFGNQNPVELELGCGKGRLLLNRAESNPEINFLAIDLGSPWLKKGQKSAERRELKNILFFKAEAHYFLKDCLLPESIQVIHVNFPDPWPKKKHHKRRFVNSQFFQLVKRTLVPGGLLEIATDHDGYYEYMLEHLVLSETDWSEKKEQLNKRFLEEGQKTNYEVKFEIKGKDRHYMELKK